jgi:predicted MFS family arabinose efflux permease
VTGLTELDWRATFLVPGPRAIALLVAGIKVIPHADREQVSLSHFDLTGAFTSTASLLVLVYASLQLRAAAVAIR